MWRGSQKTPKQVMLSIKNKKQKTNKKWTGTCPALVVSSMPLVRYAADCWNKKFNIENGNERGREGPDKLPRYPWLTRNYPTGETQEGPAES